MEYSFAEVFFFLFFFLSLFKKIIGSFGSIFFKIRLKNLMGRDVLNFPIFLQVFD